MYCGSALEPVPTFPEFFAFPTTEMGPVSPLTSSFVQTFLVFLGSAVAEAVASGGCVGELAGAGLAAGEFEGEALCARHVEPLSTPQKARTLQKLCNRVIKPPMFPRAEVSSSTLNPVYRT